MVVQSSLSNIAIIFLMHLCIDIFLKRSNLAEKQLWLGMVSFVSAAVIIMFYLPIKFGGFQFDLRLIPLVFLAFKWGPRYAFLALFVTCSWRFGMGGEGALPGIIFGMILPVLFTLVSRKVKNSSLKPFTLFILISISWLISDLPIIFLVPEGWSVFKEIGVMRFFSFQLTAFVLYFFIISTEKEISLKEQLQYYAERDPLTNLINIRTFERKIKSYPESTKEMFIIMIDIDHFKAINDKYGHLNGDLIIKSVADLIVGQTSCFGKENFILGRYGGEEFILFMEAHSRKEMLNAVESIREEIERTTFYTEDKKPIKSLTVSIGVSELSQGNDLHHAIEKADKWLYYSKRNGRNQISGA